MNLTPPPRRTSLVPALVVLGLLCTALSACRSNPAREERVLNVDAKGIALEGYDPVAYFPEGGGRPKRGDSRLSSRFEGATYLFATQANFERFQADPKKYVPRYGGWCAWAMADGEKVEINPKAFLLDDDGLLLFYRTVFVDTERMWREGDSEQLELQADEAWARLSAPRPEAGR